MIVLITTVFVASVMRSMHCAGMCGAFLAFAVVGEATETTPKWLLHAAYNGGRLVVYTVIGVLAGLLGSAIDLGGAAAGLQRAAAALAGAAMVVFGVLAILRLKGVRVPRAPLPMAMQRAVGHAHRTAIGWPPVARALSVGLLTTLLPCGWLYAFAITAAGTADPFKGAAAMAAFWAGTLPIMIVLGASVQRVAGPLRRHAPIITSIALVAVGLLTITTRFVSVSGLLNPGAGEAPCCHEP